MLRVRFHIIGHARIENVGKYQSCMVSKLPIIWKQTVPSPKPGGTAAVGPNGLPTQAMPYEDLYALFGDKLLPFLPARDVLAV